MFGDETALYPDDVLKLGCYLRLRIDVGLAMTTMILTENEQVLHRSTYQPLTPEFMSKVYEKLGSHVLPRELEDLGLKDTPQYDPNNDVAWNE